MDQLQSTGNQCKEPNRVVPPPSPPSPEESVTTFIESQLASILYQLMLEDGKPCITLKKRHSSKQANYSLNPDTGALEDVVPACRVVSHTYSWPGKTAQETWRFAVILRILGHIHEAIKGEFTSTKRDVYYLDPVHFGNQAVVDRYVDDIAFTIGVDRAALHVQAAAKGLIAGRFTIGLDNGATIDVGKFSEGLLIPRVESITRIGISDINWILVVEKEAVFHRLLVSKYHELSTAGQGIILTGKGYPDISTRQFLRLLSDTIESNKTCSPSSLSTPPKIFILVDGDPDGISIVSTYKYGSLSQAHENRNLNVPNVVWLGLRTSEFVMTTTTVSAFRVHMLDGSNGSGGGNTTTASNCKLVAQDRVTQNFINLRPRDRKKATWMLSNSPVFAEDGPEDGWRRELQSMMLLGVKAEIEIVYDLDGGIDEWLDRELKKAMHTKQKDRDD